MQTLNPNSDSTGVHHKMDRLTAESEPIRRKSMFDQSTLISKDAWQTPRRKSYLDNVSMDLNLGEDLGFQWTPSMSLRHGKNGSIDEPSSNHHAQIQTPQNRKSHCAFKEEITSAVYFNDGKRRIDYVLVYDKGSNDQKSKVRPRCSASEKIRMRQFFQENLRKDGLQLEEDVVTRVFGDTRTVNVFIKVHATWPALCRQAELLKMKMPLRLRDTFVDQKSPNLPKIPMMRRCIKLLRLISQNIPRVGGPYVEEEAKMNEIHQDFDQDAQHDSYSFVTWPFQCNKIDKYAIIDQDTFFTPTQRMEMVWEILQNAKNDSQDEKKRGIEQLLDLGIYSSAYPVHDGPAAMRKTQSPSKLCERQQLRNVWANWKCLFKPQPLELIRRYYGEKVGFYFAFLGFYTKMLTVPAIFGLCTFFYGLAYGADESLVQDVCDESRAPGNFTMCPICRMPNCEFTKLSDSCSNVKWDYSMDNEATLFMAIVSVIWSTIFMKVWKRRESKLAYEWDTHEVQHSDGVVRPDYEERASSTRRNPITLRTEPYVPWSLRSWWLLWSAFITLIMLFAVGAALGCLVLARVALYGWFRELGIHHSVQWARWFVHALIFIVVTLFDSVYNWLGRKATSLECPRTQSQWLSSFLWKLFIFELLNDFVPIGYAAWLKGLTIRTPLDFTWMSEICESAGCMGEVSELIAILLMARLIVGNAIEIGLPFLKHVFAKLISKHRTRASLKLMRGQDSETSRQKFQWRSDNLLNELELDGVADEYMEMITQFAFVTLIVPAFPIAPLVCLLNNILEIRIDAIKFIVSHRRPLPMRVPGIQIWNEFLDIVSKLSVLCNAALISFTSGMIPRLYYKYAMNNGSDYKGFIEYSLSLIPTSVWCQRNETDSCVEVMHKNITHCYYQNHRHSDPGKNFDLTDVWWKIMCARLTVFCLFIALAFSFQWIYDFLVPDLPTDVDLKMQRRHYVVTKAMEAEMISDKWFAKNQTNDPNESESGPATEIRMSDVIKRKLDRQNGSKRPSVTFL